MPARPNTQPEIDPTHGRLLHAQPKLPRSKVWLGSEELITGNARSERRLPTGMMFRTNMPEKTAMIFVFDHQAKEFLHAQLRRAVVRRLH
jgi:hypothetical protein